MSIRIDVTSKNLDKPPIKKNDQRKFLIAVALQARRTIHRRSSKGLNKHGKRFRRYTPSYAAWKRSKGRKPGTPGDWLRFTGDMLRQHDIISRTQREVLLGFLTTDTAVRAKATNRQRPWIGLKKKEKDRAINAALKHLKVS